MTRPKGKAIFQLFAELRSHISDENRLKTLEELQARVAEEERGLEKQKQVYEDEISILKRLSNISGEEAKFRLADLEREVAGLKRENLEAKVAAESANRKILELNEEVERLEKRSSQLRGDQARLRGQWVWNVETLEQRREILKREMDSVDNDFKKHVQDWAETVVMMREKSSADKSEVKERLFAELYRLMARQKQLIVSEERLLMNGLAGFIQNQIGGLGGTAQLLKERSRKLPQQNDTEFITQVLSEKSRAIEKLEEGLQSFAELNHQPELKAEKVTVGAALEHWLAASEAWIQQSKLDVQKDLGATAPVMLDENLLGLAIQEMAANAADGGARELRLKTEKDPGGAWVGFSVSDNGPGIPEHLHEKIFQPFFSTRKGRAGLGLSKALRWIALMGGELTIEPAEGAGAKFLARFPVYESVSLDTP